VCVRCQDQVLCTYGHAHCRVHCVRCTGCDAALCPLAVRHTCADGPLCDGCALPKLPTHCTRCTAACVRCLDRVAVACEHCSLEPTCDLHLGQPMRQCQWCPRAWCGRCRGCLPPGHAPARSPAHRPSFFGLLASAFQE